MAIQNQILNKILQTKNASIITLNNLTVDLFCDYKAEFNFIKEHIDTYGNVPDMATFLGRFDSFTVLPEVEETDKYLLSELANDRRRRFLTESYNDLRPLLVSGTPEAIERANQIIKEASEFNLSTLSVNAVDIIHDTSRYEEYEDMINNLDKYFIKTGFKELDDIIGGWNAKEDIVTIVARNGLGKSWILFKCAAAAAKQGKRVGLYSGEMGTSSVGYRVDTLIGGISNGALVHGNASVRNEYKKFLDNLPNEIKGNLWVLTPRELGGAATPSALRAFIERYKLDILLIDQNSLLEDDKKAVNPVTKAANISNDLKILQSTKEVPIICVNQQNREKLDNDKNGNKTYDTTQVAGSDRIAQDSSIIIFIQREGNDTMKLHLIKSRNSGSGNILTYRIDLNTGKFIFVPATEGNNVSNDSGYSEDEVF